MNDMPDEIAAMIPPNNVNAERSVLGAIFVGIADTGSAQLSPEDFYLHDHRMIFEAMRDLHARRQPVDVVTVAEALESAGHLDDIGGMQALGVFHDCAATIKSFSAHADIVRGHAKARELRAIASRLMSASGDDWEDVAGDVVSTLLATSRTTGRWDCDLKSALRAGIDVIEAAHDSDGLVGVDTGFTRLNELFGGFQRSDFIVIGARPAMGKTAFLLNLAMNANVPVAIVSAEMPRDQLALRLISRQGRINATRLRNADLHADDWQKITAASGVLMQRDAWILDKPAPSLAEVANFARRMKTQHGVRALYLDYLQRMRPRDRSIPKHEQIGELAMGLKELARELDMPVIALAQVNRDVEKRVNRRPSMGDLKHSGEIEQEADCVMLIYRDEVYNDSTPDRGLAEIIIDKNRHGEIGTVKLGWQGEHMNFSNFAPTVYGEEAF